MMTAKTLCVRRRSKNFLEQKRRLEAEGVQVNSGKVDLKRYGWQRNLDAELWRLP